MTNRAWSSLFLLGALLALPACEKGGVAEPVPTVIGGEGGGGSAPIPLDWGFPDGGAPGSCDTPPASAGNQAYTSAWAAGLGDGVTPLQGDFIAPSADGGVFFSGGVGGMLDLGGGVTVQGDGRFLAKLDADGHAQWAKLLDDPIARLATSPAGDLWTWGKPDGGPPYITKHELDGSTHLSLSYPADIVVPTADGGALFAKAFSGQVTYLGVTHVAADQDIMVVRLDPQGTPKWATALSSLLPPLPPKPAKQVWAMTLGDLAASPDGSASVAAYVVKLDNANGATGKERVLYRLDANGDAQWMRRMAAPASSPEMRLAADPGGGLILLTLSGSAEDVDLGCGTHWDAGLLLASYDAAGNHRWERFFEGQLGVNRPGFDPAGNIVIAGELEGKVDLGGGAFVDHGSQFAIYVARYAPDGQHLASKLYDNSPPDESWLLGGECRAEGAAVDGAGNVLLTGYYAGALAFDGIALPSVPVLGGQYYTNALVAKLVPAPPP
ncbi:MAG: hypothetical protein U0359_10345 [Byssovorax sp.]